LQKRPTDAIKQFLNPFLLDQYFFAKKSELEKNRYFIELFNVDVTKIKKDITDTDQAAKILRAKIDTYGEIDITPIEKVDVYAFTKQRNNILNKYASDKLVLDEANEVIKNDNIQISKFKERRDEIVIEKEKAELLLKCLNNEYRKVCDWIGENPDVEILPNIPLPETAEIDEKISDAKMTNVKHERYLENKTRYDEKQSKNIELSVIEKQLRELRANKVKQLAEISDKCGIEGLVFDENAVAKYEGSTLGMISKSQVMRLSSALNDYYPPGFGLKLLDGAESLGFGLPDLKRVKNVQIYIDRAKKDESTILATVVSDKPASVPDEVGVFMIEEGEIK